MSGETLHLRLSEVSLIETLRGAAACRQATDAGVQIKLDVPRAASCTLMRAGSSRLSTTCSTTPSATGAPITLAGAVGEQVHIRVTDVGPGIPTELVPRLFERFAISGPSGGTGLGLYLVREIARGHGGEAEY